MEIRPLEDKTLIDFLRTPVLPWITDVYHIDGLDLPDPSHFVLAIFLYHTALCSPSVIFAEVGFRKDDEEEFCSEIFSIDRLEAITLEEVSSAPEFIALEKRWRWDWEEIIEYVIGYKEQNMFYGLN
jgi:hypothetical protein